MQFHFYDLLTESVIDPKEELKRLCSLFSSEKLYSDGSFTSYSLEKYIDMYVFRGLSFRGSYINISDMRSALNLSENDFNLDFSHSVITIETLFLFSEFLLALAMEGERKIREEEEFNRQMSVIVENIIHFVNKTNHRLENISDNDTAHYIIVEKNKLTSQAVELVTDRTVALAAIEYNHFALRGKLDKKQSILNAIANHVEPILKSNILKHNGFAQLQSDAGFVLNNFHIRHNNKDGANRKDYIASISDGDLEKWYDKAYNILLSVIVEQENVATHSELETLKSTYNWN